MKKHLGFPLGYVKFTRVGKLLSKQYADEAFESLSFSVVSSRSTHKDVSMLSSVDQFKKLLIFRTFNLCP
jgi:hypothetical protein